MNNFPELGLTETVCTPKTILSERGVVSPQRLSEGAACRFCPDGGESVLLVDFGRLLIGDLEAVIRSEGAGTASFYYGEFREEAERTAEYGCGWYVLPKDVFALNGQTCTVRSNGRRAFRYLCIRVTGAPAELSVKMTDVRYPVQRRGSFCCSDPLLNRIWTACAETVSGCMQHYYEDGVKRDGLLWLGDYRVTFPAAWYAFGDGALAARSLRMMAASQREDGSIPGCASVGGGHQHPDRINYMPGIPHGSVGNWLILNYCTDFVSAVYEYYCLTGDGALARELYPAVRRLMDFLEGEPLQLALSPDSLCKLDAPGTPGAKYDIFVDCRTDPNGFIASPCSYLFMLAKAMEDCTRLAALAGDEAFGERQKALRTELLDSVRTRFYDPESDLYRDREEQPKQPATPLYTAVHGALCGVSTEAGLRGLAEAPLGVYPYFTAWELSVMFEHGLAQPALDAVRKHWGRMFSLSDTCWERLDADLLWKLHPDDAPCSLCHGWGAHPVYQLPAHLLGIRPVSAGFADAVIEPQLCDLNWAEATVPTPRGEIFARAEKAEGGIRVQWEVPDGIRAVLRVNGGETVIAGRGAC